MNRYAKALPQLLLIAAVTGPCWRSLAQAPSAPPAAAAPAARQIGTVESVSENALIVKPDKVDAAQQITVSLAPGVRVLELAPGSTDLKTAQPAAAGDIAVGDRVLLTGAVGDTASTFTARRVILMRSAAIDQRHQADDADWQQRGTGGIVSAVDSNAQTIEIASGARKTKITTTSKTIVRRYSNGSVRFADAVKGTLADVHAGDQLRVRGTRSADGSTIDAEEIVSGSFTHISGTVLSIDAAARRLVLKDLRTKKTMTVEFAETSSIRTLPPEMAQRFASHGKSTPGAAHPASASAAPAPAAGSGSPRTAEAEGSEAGHGAGGRDLGQLVARLPETPLTDLHKGDAVLIVGVPKSTPDTLIAVTLLAGVEPILAANPNGVADSTLSPWNLGGAPEGGSQ